MISQVAEIPPFFMIVLDVWFKKRVNDLSSTGGKRGLIDICCMTQNAALLVSLL